MKTQKIFFTILLSSFIFLNCKNGEKQENTTPKTTIAVNSQKVSLDISGMSCAMNCASTIQKKLAKKEGVLNAKVVFNDSIATVEFDANTTSKKELIALVNGIAGGIYKASETKKEAHACTEACKTECEAMKGETACKEDCKMDCCTNKNA